MSRSIEQGKLTAPKLNRQLTVNWQEFRLAIIISFVIHIFVLTLLLVSWSSTPPAFKSVQPKYVKAVVVERPQKKKTVKTKAQKKVKKLTKKIVKKSKKVLSKSTVKKSEKKKVQKKKLEIPKEDLSRLFAEEELDFNQREKEKKQQEKKDHLESELQKKVAEEETSRQISVVEEYTQLIQQAVAGRWNRPPSARNGMEAILKIHLLPGGEVLDASVIKSSGDLAFDRSAENSVRLLGQLPVPSDPVIFDKFFRQLSLGFRPEDLRL